MKTIKLFVSALGVASAFGVSATPVSAKDGVLNSVKHGESNYCHMHFPAIDERTLSWERPVLQDPSTGDIIHFYGPCDYDPHGKEAVQSQKLDASRRWQREYSND